MKKQLLTGECNVYYAPIIKQLAIRCEAGFSASVEADELTPEDGEWDY